MKENLVSVVTPVFNAEDFIEETINSVLNQTYTNFEMILVDDCSNDSSQFIIQEATDKDSRIKYVRLEKNSGAAVARNKGIEMAEGQYIAFLDSDDIWKKDKLQRQLDFLTNNNYAFTYTAFETIHTDGKIKKDFISVPNKLSYSGLLKNTAIACSTVLIDRKLTGDFKMPNVRKGQDTATWLQLLKIIPFAYGLNEVLSSYRQVSGSISSNKLGALKRTWNTYYRIEKLSFFKASYYFISYTINAILKRI